MSNATFLIAGQSNANFCGDARWMQAGNGSVFYSPAQNTFQQAYDFFPGWPATPTITTGGSIWSRLGYLLSNQPDPWTTCFAMCPVNGSPLAAWAQGTPNFQSILTARSGLESWGKPLTAILWMQGETDALSDAADGDYYNGFIAMVDALRFYGVACPIFVSICTECRLYGASPGTPAGCDYQALANYPSIRLNRWNWQERVQSEQRALQLRNDKGIRKGINSDLLNGRQADGCHLNWVGQDAAALMWCKNLINAKTNGII